MAKMREGESNVKDEISKKIETLTKRFMADQGYYVHGQCRICGKQGLILLVACGQWILRCYHNPEHENLSGWV